MDQLKKIESINTKIFADGANKHEMLDMYEKSYIQGLTTNPTLMHKAGIKNYALFCKDILKDITKKPISFEVFSDDFREMERQAYEIASWGKNVYVKIPIMNTKGESSYSLIQKLTNRKVKINVTAVMTLDQVREAVDVLDSNIPSFISIFAGRIADTGRDPIPLISEANSIISSKVSSELIWASPREVFNIYQAAQIGCDIITVTHDILKKLDFVDYDLTQFSLDTVKMFHKDAIKAGYTL